MTEKEEKLNNIYAQYKKCAKCALSRSRNNIVFGRGNPDAPVMFIGEAPGKNEDESGMPFVGQAGKLLEKFIVFSGLEEKDYYITNIIKCRPPMNRDPEDNEEEACIPLLRKQVAVINPKIIVCLGRIAAKRIISPDFRITRDRGKWHTAGNIKIIATYHPSALLRDPSKKYDFLTDIKEIAGEFDKIR